MEAKSERLCQMKMILYLFCQFVELQEANDTSGGDMFMSKLSARGKKSGSAGSSADFHWDSDKKVLALIPIFRLVHLNISQLFDPPIVEEDVVNMIANCLFRILETPSIAHQRSHDLRLSVFQILGTINSKFGYLFSCRLKIVQSLRHFEHLGSPLAQAVEMFVKEYGCSTVVMEIVRDICQIDQAELQRDTSATRAYSAFLSELTEKMPEMMKPCLSLLMIHLDGQSPSLRKCVLSILGEITLQVFGGGGGDNNVVDTMEQNDKDSRDQFLDCLEDHVHDVHAHVRASVLQVWSNLCSSKAIPLSRQQSLLRLVIGRLQDKSSNVRKQAVQLLTALLQCNPFTTSMPVEEFKSQLEKEKLKLIALTGKNGEEGSRDSEEEWQEMELQLQKFFGKDSNREEDEEEKEEVWENATETEVMNRITHLMTKKKTERAVSLVISATKNFPECSIFNAALTKVKEEKKDDGDISESKVAEAAYVFAVIKTAFVSKTTQQNEDQEQNEEIRKQKILVAYLHDSYQFANQINDALPVVCNLLGSKQSSDILEAIKFFVSAFEFGVLNAMVGVRQMLSLIWSREPTVKDAVMAAYRRLYVDSESANAKEKASAIVRNFIALITGATVGELTSLEELVIRLVQSKDIEKECFNLLWQYFTKMNSNTTDEESRGAILMLGMIAQSEPTVITTNLGLLVKTGLAERGMRDFKLAHDTCIALSKLSTMKQALSESTNGMCPKLKLEEDHEIFRSLESILVEGITRVEDHNYIPMSQRAVLVIYQLAEKPDVILGSILKKICFLSGQNTRIKKASLLQRLLSLVGHIALNQLNYLDVDILNELKRRKQLRDAKVEQSRRKSVGGSRKEKANKKLQRQEDEEMEVLGAEADDAEIEFIRNVCETEVITPTCLLGHFVPLIVHVCSRPKKYPNAALRASCSLALAKLMLVSSVFCEDHLQILFTLLEKSPEEIIRANLIIATGDLSFRFPNTMEPWTPHMYNRLRDSSTLVRSNTLTVLTHLILNDMIKVKGQISDMALCIADDNTKISSLAKHFFSELAQKGNALYNVMPDIISRLSDAAADVSEEKFRVIMGFIIGLIEKDKHLEALVEKLCHRFRATQVSRQWRDLAYCLALFTFNDKAVKKLSENFTCYNDKLHEDTVYTSITSILVHARKLGKTETKVIIDELEERLEKAREKCLEDMGTNNRAVAAKNVGGGEIEKQTKKGTRISEEEKLSDEEVLNEEVSDEEGEVEGAGATEEEKEQVPLSSKKSSRSERKNKRMSGGFNLETKRSTRKRKA